MLRALAFARLHGSWSRGVHALARGEDELAEFLLERIEAHGGTARLAARVTRIQVDRRGAPGVLIDVEADLTGAGFVVADGSGEQLAELSRGRGMLNRAERDWPSLSPVRARFVMSIVMRSEGVPEPLGREVVVVPSSERGLTLHIVRMDPSSEVDAPREARGESLWVVETLIPFSRAGEPLDGIAREQVLETLRTSFPFIDQHIVVLDSPHDGRPLWDFAGGTPGAPNQIERIHLQGASTAAEPMAV